MFPSLSHLWTGTRTGLMLSQLGFEYNLGRQLETRYIAGAGASLGNTVWVFQPVSP